MPSLFHTTQSQTDDISLHYPNLRNKKKDKSCLLGPHAVDDFFKVMSSSSEFAVTLGTHLDVHIQNEFDNHSHTDLDGAVSLAGSAKKVSIGATKYLPISLELLQANLKLFL